MNSATAPLFSFWLRVPCDQLLQTPAAWTSLPMGCWVNSSFLKENHMNLHWVNFISLSIIIQSCSNHFMSFTSMPLMVCGRGCIVAWYLTPLTPLFNSITLELRVEGLYVQWFGKGHLGRNQDVSPPESLWFPFNYHTTTSIPFKHILEAGDVAQW